MRRRSSRRAWPFLALAFGALLALAPALTPPAVFAATPSLTLVTDARYDVLPDEGRVAVTVDVRATNHLRDTAANRFFFEQAYLAVQPDASGFRLTANGLRPSVSVVATEPTHTLLLLRFGTRLAAGTSLALRLTFNLVDPGTPTARDIRVSDTIVTFSAWAFASDETPGSTVNLTLPQGYAVDVLRGQLSGPAADESGVDTWSSGPLETPTSFEAAIRATRAATYLESNRSASIGQDTARITFRGWVDDPAWLEQANRLVLAGAPALAEAIGRPWPLTAPLVIEEGLVGEASDTAGSFSPDRPLIEIAYYAGPEVVLHEVAHAWFNGSRLADRWANEAFASLYAELAAAGLEEPVLSPELIPEIEAARLPLNAWAAAGEAGDATERYGYAASLALGRAILRRAGPDGLAAVWLAIDSGRRPYGGRATSGPVDWRGLLDVLEAETGQSYGDLWQRYVLRPQDAPLLDARGSARDAYVALAGEVGDWPMPATIGEAMRAWRFDIAQAAIATAHSVIAQRDRLRVDAAAAGLDLPATLRESFAAGRLDRSSAELEAASVALHEIVVAGGERPSSMGPLEWLGLVGSDPETSLGAARGAFTSGDLVAAYDAASEAESAWGAAADVARGRIIGVLVGLIALGLFARLVASRGWARQVGWS
ncbi:MAG: hypothetical protein L0221_07775 [Chloroflexi bacterium]|nr:hypothetical protein [Chloroflexota bacterium]